MKKYTILTTCLFMTLIASAQNWTGTWKTSFGDLRFIQQGNKVYGDYDNKGDIIADVTGNILKGTFNNNGNKGAFEFKLTGTSFTGKWAFGTNPLGSSWTGNLIDSKKPVLTSVAKDKVGLINIKKPILTNPTIVEMNQKIFIIPKTDALNNKTVKLPNNDNATLKVVGSNGLNDLDKKESNSTTVKQNNQTCTTVKTSITTNTSDFSPFIEKGQPQFLISGSVMDHNSFLSGENKINVTKRKPIKIYLNAEAIPSGKSGIEVVDNPESLAELNSKVSNLINIAKKDVSAKMSFETNEVTSAKEFSFAVSGSYSNKLAKIAVDAGISTKSENSSYFLVLKFTQNYYSINVDPSEPISFLTNVPNARDLIYISQVTYGRKGFLIIKTSKSLKELEAKGSVKYKGNIDEAQVNALYTSLKEDKTSEIKAFYYGGDADAAAQSIADISAGMNAQQSFSKWITSNAGNSQKGLPVSYVINNLAGEQLGMTSAFDQTERTCIPIKEYKLKITLESLKCATSNDSDKLDDYVLYFTPELIIDGKSYLLENKSFQIPQKATGGANDLWVWDKVTNQLHVREGATQQIGNSGVFRIPENINLANAELRVKFKIMEMTNNSGDRLVGVSKKPDFNLHNHSLKDLLIVLEDTKNLADVSGNTRYNKDRQGTQFGNYGGNSKYILKANTVPVEEVSGSKIILRAGEYMKNETLTRAIGINYTFELVE